MPKMGIQASYYDDNGVCTFVTELITDVDSLKEFDQKLSVVGRTMNDEKPEPTVVKEENYSPLAQELQHVLNKYSAESVSGTPDFILAEFVLDSLKAYNAAVVKRADWRGEMAEFRPSPKENWLNIKP